MPTYSFRAKDTQEIFEKFMSISEMEKYVAEDKVVILPASPKIVSGIDRKPDSNFNDLLKRIKSNHVRSNIHTY